MNLDIDRILEAGSVLAHYQPIVSCTRQGPFGLEALARASDPLSRRAVPPSELFRAARAARRSLALERLCRLRALEGFRDHFLGQPELLLFLNFDVSTLDLGVEGSGHLLRMMEELGVPPERVVIEIVENRVANVEALVSFIRRHRQAGFLVALDDVGAGHSNLDRIALLKPDILKLDASLVRGVESSFHQQEVFKSLVGLSHRIGALVLAEGVETAPEALASLELGADLLQGYYFCRPAPPSAGLSEGLAGPLDRLAKGFRRTQVARLKYRRSWYQRFSQAFNQALVRLVGEPPSSYAPLLKGLAAEAPDLLNIYVLNERGIQVAGVAGPAQPQSVHPLRRPHYDGMDHSMKEFFYLTYETSLKRFTTEPYVSMANGRLCVTLAGWFRSPEPGAEYLLCMDVLEGGARA